MSQKKVSLLPEILETYTKEEKEKTAYLFYDTDASQVSSFTFGELALRISVLANYLQKRIQKGERVLLVYPPSLEFIVAFLACLSVGAIAVPVYPASDKKGEERLNRIMQDCSPKVILSTNNSVPSHEVEGHPFERPILSQQDIAFLQYTSGSTGHPKGVMVSHGNLMNNLILMHEVFHTTDQDTIVTWLPQYHDMGLIGGILQPFFMRTSCVMMSPLSFLQNPYAWLHAISKHPSVVSGAPNFAYDYCVRKITDEQKKSLDLNSWRVAFNGAEPIHQDTLERFYEAFSMCGFKKESFFPCYGLAEATLIVSGGPDGTGFKTCDLPSGKTLVGSGRLAQHVRIVNPITCIPCETDEEGEIWVHSPSVTQGYWNQPEVTQEVFYSRLHESAIDDPDSTKFFLRTGDLGFMHEGELYVTGRLKDLIIINGKNHYPQDIEDTVVRSHEYIHLGGVVAFSRENQNEEKLFLVVEIGVKNIPELDLKKILEKISKNIYQNVAQYHDIFNLFVAFVSVHQLPKTTSGKLQRKLTKEMLQAEKFSLYGTWSSESVRQIKQGANEFLPPRTAMEQTLAKIWGDILGRSQISISDDFFSLGAHSLVATQLVSRLRQELDIDVPLRTIFEKPQVGQLAQAIEELMATKGKSHLFQITPLSVEQRALDLSLSFAEQRLWVLDQLEGGASTSYLIPGAVALTGELRLEVLMDAFREIQNRHEILRTCFVEKNHSIVRKVLSAHECHFPFDVYQEWEEAKSESSKPFNLSEAPLWRAALFSKNKKEYVLFLTMHHIISDGWSMGIFIKEFSEIYSAFLNNQPSPLEPLAIQYADFSFWQRQWFETGVLERQLSYWKEQLRGLPDLINLPTDFPRPLVQTFQGHVVQFSLPKELTTKIHALAKENQATFFMVLLAAFQVLLMRMTGSNDVAVGSPIANRSHTSVESLIGFFANTLVLRGTCQGEETFLEFLEQTKRTTLDAYTHQDVPFERLVEALNPVRSLAQTPLFQVMFVLQNNVEAQLQLPGVDVGPFNLDLHVAKFDLTLAVSEGDISEKNAGCTCEFEYNTALFLGETIQRMADHLIVLLQGIVEKPTEQINLIPLLTETERHQLLVTWNDTKVDYPKDKCIHQLFEEQVLKSPDAIAVVFEESSLTYAELNRRANHIAHHLISLGVQPDTLVGIAVERSLEMIVGLLGILKAGGAYVPIDPSYPKDRIAYMLEDSAVNILLTQSFVVGQLPVFQDEKYQRQIILLDQFNFENSKEKDKNPKTTVAPNSLAYVIYTSGSTGRPKGVILEHRSLINHMLWLQNFAQFNSDDCFLQKTPFSFDASIWEFFAPLFIGAKLVFLDQNELKDLNIFIKTIIKNNISILQLVPALLDVISQQPELRLCTSLRKVFCGGDSLSQDVCKNFYSSFNDNKIDLINLYGPTECCIDSHSFKYQISKNYHVIPIGHTIDNLKTYILDPSLNPAPIGIPGELHIGGVGLARGYLNRPDLTSEKFIQNPFSNDPKDRIYKTGDLARYLPDGNIEYLGRIDNQVKIRGFRIELGEIESALNQYPGVQSAVVIAREDQPGEKRLVAYYTANSNERLGDSPTGEDVTILQQEGITAPILRQHLEQTLPNYMIPAAFVQLEVLPLTPNGKIDRKALPAPEYQDTSLEYQAPQTDLEIQLATIWSEVLSVPQIGLQDNFFHLGGHSLLATQLISQIRQKLNVEIPLRMIFEKPRLGDLAQCLEDSLRTQENIEHKTPSLVFTSQQLVPLRVEGKHPPLLFVHAATGTVDPYLKLTSLLETEHALYGIQAVGLNDHALPLTAVSVMAAHYIKEIQGMCPSGPYILGGWSLGGVIAFEVARQLKQHGHEVKHLFLFDSFNPGALRKTIYDPFFKKSSDEIEEFLIGDFIRSTGIFYDSRPDENSEHVKKLFVIYKANMFALKNYAPQKYTGSITLFQAQQDLPVAAKESASGWLSVCKNISVVPVEGSHHSIVTGDDAEVLAENLKNTLKMLKN